MKQNFTYKGLARLYFIMRVSFLNLALLTVSCLQVLNAKPARGQTLENTFVDVPSGSMPLKSVLSVIEEQTDFFCVFPPELVQHYPAVTVPTGYINVKELLDKAVEGIPIAYRVSDKNVVLYSLVNQVDDKISVITGIVIESNGRQPIPGVSILIKGTSMGTSTDVDGRYAIEASIGDVLVFTSIGYKIAEVAVESKSVIDVAMEEDVTTLEGITINHHYYNVEKESETGSVSRVASSVIENQPVSNALAAIGGRMPGVYIQQNTGIPGGGFSIKIRGTNSLRREGNNPLYVVDGVPYTPSSISSSYTSGVTQGGNPLGNINPLDIENIEVLKDADATALYGSRGANGVVLITTKKGKRGKTKFDLNAYKGVGTISRKMKLLSTSEYLAMRREAYRNDGKEPSEIDGYDILKWDTTRFTDWQDVLIGGTASITNVQTSISGGGENTQFSISGGYYGESTVLPGSFLDRKLSAHINLSHSSTNKKFGINFTASYLNDDNNLPSTDFVQQAITLPPIAPKIYDGDHLNWENSTWDNPFTYLYKEYKSVSDNLITNVLMHYNISNSIRVRLSSGYTKLSVNETLTTPSEGTNPAWGITNGSTIFAKSYIGTWISEPQIEYSKDLPAGKITGLIGTTFQQNMSASESILAYGYSTDALLENIGSAGGLYTYESKFSQYRYAALYGRLNFNLKQKYLFNLVGRRDGSSRFGSNKRFGNFGAVGLGWILSNEKFFGGLTQFMSFAKIRGSFGVTGSDQIGDYEYLDSYSSSGYPYMGVSGLSPVRLSNADYSWETNRKLEIAMETGFLNDALTLSANWYLNRSSNQLVGYPLPLLTGKSSVQYNLPATVQNTGLELQLDANLFGDRSLVKWRSSLNVTIPRTKLVSYPDLAASSYSNTYLVGESLSIANRLHFVGVDPQTGIGKFEDKNNNGSSYDYPGDAIFLKQIGQRYYGGLSNALELGAFSVDIFFQFVNQTGVNYQGAYSNSPGMISNQPSEVLGRWQAPGDISDIQRFTQDTGSPAYEAYAYGRVFGDNTISDASFIRLKNVSIVYKLPMALLSRMEIHSLKFFLQGQNLLTITRYRGMDPEAGVVNSLPSLRIFTMGVRVSL